MHPQTRPQRALYAVRHGEKERGDGLDPPLTPLGVQQAEATGRALKDRRFALMVVSPFRRTLQTAVHMCKALRPDKVVIDWGVGEWLDRVDWGEGPCPALDDLAANRAERDALIAELKAAPHTMARTEACPTETRDELFARAAATLAHLHSCLPHGGSLLVVTHASTHEALVRSLCPGYHPFFPDPCSLSLVTQAGGADQWSIEQAASTAHLAYLAKQQGPVNRGKR